VKDAKLTSPEAQIINSPTIVGFLNGVMSMVDTGLSNCYGGFGYRAIRKFMNVSFSKPSYQMDTNTNLFYSFKT
jgi:hypothetical protein